MKCQLENLHRTNYSSDPWTKDMMILKWILKKEGVIGCEGGHENSR